MMTLSSPIARLIRTANSRSGVIAVTTVGNLLVRMTSSVVLTRLLSPDMFGLVGIISAIFFTIGMLTDLGFQSYVVRHEDGDDRHFLNVIWTIHAVRGVGITVAAIALAPIAGYVLQKPELVWPLAVASLIILVNGLSSLSMITALRKDLARRLSWMDLGLQAFQALSSILLAIVLRSVWAIIGAMLLQAVARLILSYTIFPDSVARLARDRRVSKEFFAFSRVVMLSSTLTLIMGQTDKLVLARLFTLAQFGLYSIAINLSSAPAAFADAYVHRVVFPALARTWQSDREALPSVFYDVRRTVSLLYACACGGLIGSAGLIVAILYDPRYQSAATYLSLLAVSTAFRMPNTAGAEAMTAMGHIKTTLHANVVRLLWLAVMGTAGYLTAGTLGLIAAVGAIEIAPYLYICTVLRRFGILKLVEEAKFIACLIVPAAASYAVTTAILHIWPSL